MHVRVITCHVSYYIVDRLLEVKVFDKLLVQLFPLSSFIGLAVRKVVVVIILVIIMTIMMCRTM